MKVGDKVRIRDFSYIMVFKDGKLEHEGLPVYFKGRENVGYKIIAVNCKLPAVRYDFDKEDVKNDTIIQPLDENELIFIREEFLTPYENVTQHQRDLMAIGLCPFVEKGEKCLNEKFARNR